MDWPVKPKETLTLYELGRSGPMITNGQTQVLHHLREIFKFNLEKKIGKFHTSYIPSAAHRWFHISLPENSTIINFLPRRVSMARQRWVQYEPRLIAFFYVKTGLEKWPTGSILQGVKNTLWIHRRFFIVIKIRQPLFLDEKTSGMQDYYFGKKHPWRQSSLGRDLNR